MKLLITLDYELYNGKYGGSIENCIIKPTWEFLKVLDKYSVKATFFVDTVFLNRLLVLKEQNSSLENDWKSIQQQLSYLHAHGHDLQLHLHPQWYHATYEDEKWQSVLSDYKLSDMPRPVVAEMFDKGVSLLNSINNHKTVAYRAGAYCIQTLDDYHEFFLKNGLKIDSSVNRNMSSKTPDHQWYDYTNIPKSYIYHFEDDVTKEKEGGVFLEVSIPSYRMSKLNDVINHIRRYFNNDSKTTWGDGVGSIGHYEKKKDRLWHKLTSRLHPMRVVASIDGCGAESLDNIFKKEKAREGEYIMIMGHPKSFTPYSLRLLDKFLAKRQEELESFIIRDFIESRAD